MNVTPEKAAATAEFEGKKYFFCAKSCAAKFEKEPRKYLAARVPEGTQGAEQGHGGGLVSIGVVTAGNALGEKSPARKAASMTASTTSQTKAGDGAGIRY